MSFKVSRLIMTLCILSIGVVILPAQLPQQSANSRTRARELVDSSDEMALPSSVVLQEVQIVSPRHPAATEPSLCDNSAPIDSAVVDAADAADDDLHRLNGLASWYGGKFQGRTTANGEIFDTNNLTAAHKTLPFDTQVRVINLATCQEVQVRINDRGPFVEGRVIDLSRAAAEAIGVLSAGVSQVRLQIEGDAPLRVRHIIQIAAFGEQENANELANILRRAGLEPAIEKAPHIDAYRVVLRDIAPNEIDAVRAQLTEIGFSQVLVR